MDFGPYFANTKGKSTGNIDPPEFLKELLSFLQSLLCKNSDS